MSEKYILSVLCKDKQITNPINKSEMFNCGDLYMDYANCRQLVAKGVMRLEECRQIRRMAWKCYLNEEEEFERLLVRAFEEKIKLIRHLKQEGSILYEKYKEDPTVFTVKKIPDSSQSVMQNELNDYISSKYV